MKNIGFYYFTIYKAYTISTKNYLTMADQAFDKNTQVEEEVVAVAATCE